MAVDIDHTSTEKESIETFVNLRKEVEGVDPITSVLSQALREKIQKVYSSIKYNATYVANAINDEFLEIAIDDSGNNVIPLEHFQAGLIVGYLMNRCNTLTIGSPGSGKTSTIRAVSRMMTGSSISKMENIVHCDFEVKKDDWLGSKDPSEIFKGKSNWLVYWAKWVNSKNYVDIIFDEINRASDDIQNQLLLLLADSRVQYGVQFPFSLPELHTFMTLNPRDELAGTINVRPLQYAFKDRITQCLRVPLSARYAMERLSECREDDRSLGFNEDAIITPILTLRELRLANLLVEKVPIDPEARRLAMYLAREAGICIRAPMFDKTLLTEFKPGKDSAFCEGCHFAQNEQICKRFFGGSMRIFKDLISLGKAYAFWLKIPAVTKHIIHAIAPDVIGHRIIVAEGELRTDLGNTFGDAHKFIQDYYITFCWERLKMRKEVEETYIRLLDGEGSDADFQQLLRYAKNDLAVRLELLPIVSIGDGIRGTLNNYVSMYNCTHPDYKRFMKRVNEAKYNQDIHALDDLINEVPDIPLKTRIQDRIYAIRHRLHRQQQSIKK